MHGPSAATEATRVALRRIAELDPDTLILVEGISDQIAVETLARRRDRDLDAEGVVVLPVGGAQGIGHFVERFDALDLVGLCDAAEVDVFRRAMERHGYPFHVCSQDLEDELIRALGMVDAHELMASNGDLQSFRTLQKQAAWQGRSPESQLRRFLGSGARRKSRYARLLIEAIAPDRIPAPLDAVLSDVK